MEWLDIGQTGFARRAERLSARDNGGATGELCPIYGLSVRRESAGDLRQNGRVGGAHLPLEIAAEPEDNGRAGADKYRCVVVRKRYDAPILKREVWGYGSRNGGWKGLWNGLGESRLPPPPWHVLAMGAPPPIRMPPMIESVIEWRSMARSHAATIVIVAIATEDAWIETNVAAHINIPANLAECGVRRHERCREGEEKQRRKRFCASHRAESNDYE